MEGKRFAAGLVGGLLVGLVIVTATSGFTFGLYGSFSSVNNNVGMQLSSSTGPKSTSTIGGQPVSPPSQNSSNSTFSTIGRSTMTTTTSSSPGVADLSPANGVKFSSHVDSIAQQPVLTNAFILLPVLFAFLLGAVIYRTSMKRQGNTTEEAE